MDDKKTQGEGLVFYQRNLPHWRMSGATYFVTFNLDQDQKPFKPNECDLVLSALKYFNLTRYRLWAWVVMDDHVHLVVTPLDEWQLGKILHSWKSFTANAMQKKTGRVGQVWLHDSFDRIIRDEMEMMQKCEYVMNNPLRKWPDEEEYSWVGFDFAEHV